MPPLSFEEALETTKIHSVAGVLDSKAGLVGTRPFRAPHYTISDAGLIRGGAMPRPGEVSLGHRGGDPVPNAGPDALGLTSADLQDIGP